MAGCASCNEFLSQTEECDVYKEEKGIKAAWIFQKGGIYWQLQMCVDNVASFLC